MKSYNAHESIELLRKMRDTTNALRAITSKEEIPSKERIAEIASGESRNRMNDAMARLASLKK